MKMCHKSKLDSEQGKINGRHGALGIALIELIVVVALLGAGTASVLRLVLHLQKQQQSMNGDIAAREFIHAESWKSEWTSDGHIIWTREF